MTNPHTVKPVRRIVTGHTADGRSTVVNDGPAPNVFVSDTVEGFGATVPWQTEPGGLVVCQRHYPRTAQRSGSRVPGVA